MAGESIPLGKGGPSAGPSDRSLDIYDLLREDEEEDKDSGDVQSADDANDMRRMGHKQEFKRNFHSLAVLGLTCVLLQTWSSVLSYAQFQVINGGRAGAIWTYLGAFVFQTAVAASLAEMASMAPTAGGQYHWVSEFAPKRFQKIFSYLSGWLAALGWQTFIVDASFGSASVIFYMATATYPSFEPTAWQTTLLTIAIGILAILFNVFAAKRLPLFEGVVLFGYVLGLFTILIPLWVIAPKVPAKIIFTEFANYGGWATTGAACLIGQQAAAAAFIGVDSAAHMSEEVKHASKTVPRMMMFTIILNGILGFVMLVTFIAVIEDPVSQIVNSDAAYPSFWIFKHAVNDSSAGAIGMNIVNTIVGMCAVVNSVMAASRQAWSFARDDGLPYSRWFTKLTTVDGTPQPINAMCGSLIILVIIALLNLAGDAVVESILGLLNGAVGTTYVLSIGCVLWRRLFGEPLPPARFSLGRFGIVVNAISVLYQAMTTITTFFPTYSKVDVGSMNWSVVVYGGVIIIALINYFMGARKKYKGPVVRIIKED